MINWPFGRKEESKGDSNPEDLNNPKFWEDMGIKPIICDTNEPNYIEKVGNEVCDRINQVVEELKKDNSN